MRRTALHAALLRRRGGGRGEAAQRRRSATSRQDSDFGSVRRVPRPLPGRRRRAALADPAVARPGPAESAGRGGGGSAGTSGSRRGATPSRCTGADGAEAYVTPVADDCVGHRDPHLAAGPFDNHLDEFPALRDRVHGHPHGRDRAAGPLRQRVRDRARAGCCWSVTRPATSTRSPVKAWVSRSAPPSLLVNSVLGRPARRLRPAVAADVAPLPAADRGDAAGQPLSVGALANRARAPALPAAFTGMVNLLAY